MIAVSVVTHRYINMQRVGVMLFINYGVGIVDEDHVLVVKEIGDCTDVPCLNLYIYLPS